MKALNEVIDRTITYLGKSNDSEIVTAALAACKLILVPFATMSDKKTTKEQKEYAVKRDFLTEGVALTGYIGITKALKNNLTGPICSKYYKNRIKKIPEISDNDKNILSNIDAKALKNNAMSELSSKVSENYTKEQKEHIAKLEGIVKKFPNQLQNPKELYMNTKKTLSHVCVCTLALTLIPFTTNKILEIIKKRNNNKPQNTEQKELSQIPQIKKPLNFNQYMMATKLGGNNVFRY